MKITKSQIRLLKQYGMRMPIQALPVDTSKKSAAVDDALPVSDEIEDENLKIREQKNQAGRVASRVHSAVKAAEHTCKADEAERLKRVREKEAMKQKAQERLRNRVNLAFGIGYVAIYGFVTGAAMWMIRLLWGINATDSDKFDTTLVWEIPITSVFLVGLGIWGAFGVVGVRAGGGEAARDHVRFSLIITAFTVPFSFIAALLIGAFVFCIWFYSEFLE
ncbi:MAG: hypothetical protein MJA84_17900 [Firmicutes bacterium]|nr:hypothetical protein [Bacillota bacterium]